MQTPIRWRLGYIQEMVKTIRGLGGIAITSTQGMQDLFSLDNGKYGKGILDSSRIKIVMQMEEQEARLIQNVSESLRGRSPSDHTVPPRRRASVHRL